MVNGNILVVLPKFIGDAINCTPAITMLKQLYPNNKIILLTRPNLTEIFQRDDNITVMTRDSIKRVQYHYFRKRKN